MDIKTQHKLSFLGVNIIKLSFDSSQMYDGTTKINIIIEPKVFYPKQKRKFFNIVMDVNISAKNNFDLSFFAIGDFELNRANIPLKEKKRFVDVNAPAIMLPYVRSFVTTFTSSIGQTIGTLIFPPRFLRGQLEEVEIPKSKSYELKA